MCGRYSMTASHQDIERLFAVAAPGPLPPRYNIAPGQKVPAVRSSSQGHLELVSLFWGLIPHWAQDTKIASRTVMARAETVADKPAFTEAFRQRRCLLIATGYYEWNRSGERRQPYLMRRRDGSPFALAGLWERYDSEDNGEVIESCAVITTVANSLVAGLHERMPVILAPEHYALWLDVQQYDSSELKELLVPYPGDLMEGYAVSLRVNDPHLDDAGCVEPALGSRELPLRS